jgi:hypothetical protein
VSVIKHEFGKKKCQSARRLRTLLSLDALHEANVLANPVPYLERASERIFQLEKILFEAAQATEPVPGQPLSRETVQVSKAEYQRLLNCRAIIEQALADLATRDDT